MRRIALILLLIISLSSCKSTKSSTQPTRKSVTTNGSISERNAQGSTSKEFPILTNPETRFENSKLAEDIIDYAKKFDGVRYKYGGTTKSGMDCSGLVTTAFKSENIDLPRTSRDLSSSGDWVDLKAVQKGDLLFFATARNSRNVNHVGLVTEVKLGQVEFIHSTTSSGVITSSLGEKYWYFAFVQARRVL